METDHSQISEMAVYVNHQLLFNNQLLIIAVNDGILIGLCASAYYCYYIAIVCVVIDSGGFSF